MVFKNMSGIRLPIDASRRSSERVQIIGDHGKLFTGLQSKNNRGYEGRTTEDTQMMDQCCADVVEAMMLGEGYTFPFIDDVWSKNSGLGPELGSSWTLVKDDGPVCTRRHSVIADGGGLTYNPGFIDGRWTAVYFVKEAGVWNHKIVRSDGSGFLNGVKDLAIAAGELAYGFGGVSFSVGTQIAGLALLPWWLCNDLAPGVYGWMTGYEMCGYWHLEYVGVDALGLYDGTITGSPTRAHAQIRTGLSFAPGDAVELDNAAPLSLFAAGAVTIEGWIRAAGAGENDEGRIFDFWNGSDTGYFFATAPGVDQSAGKLSLRFVVGYATSNALYEVHDVVTPGEDTYVAVRFDGTTCTIYASSEEPLVLSTSTAGVGALNDDAGNIAYIGNNEPNLDRAFDGVICDVRHHKMAVPDQVLKGRFIAGRNRRRVPGPQPFAALPELPIWGHSTGWRMQNYIGDVRDEKFQPLQDETGARIFKRRLSIELDTSGADARSGLAGADFMIHPRLVSTTNPLSPSTMRSLRAGGDVSWQVSVATDGDIGNRGPYGYVERATRFRGAHYLRSTNSILSQLFYGAEAVTTLAWVRRETLGTLQRIFCVADENLDARMRLGFNAVTNAVEVQYRPDTGEAHQTTTAVVSEAIIADDEWHLVGAVMDIKGDLGDIIVDGRIVNSEAIAWTANNFNNDAHAVNTIAADLDIASNFFDGEIASVGLWLRRLSPGEILSMFKKAKQGFFS